MVKMHGEKVIGTEVGINIDSYVYRYLVCCRRCSLWRKPIKGVHGKCSVTGKPKAGQALSCKEFCPTEDGEDEIILETDRINGDLSVMVLDGKKYYLDDDEVASVKKSIGVWRSG